MIRLDNVIVRPVETEKSLSESGKYTFIIHKDSGKPEIKLAVKEFYGVDVEKVNIVNYRSKLKSTGKGKTSTRRSAGKKAIITLKEGQKLNFNDFK